MNNFSERLVTAVRQYIEGEEYKYSYSEEDVRFSLIFTTDNGDLKLRCSIYAEEDEEEARITTYCQFPINIPEKSREKIAKLLVGLNYHYKIGSYEMDIEDGEMLYKTQLYCYHGLVPPRELIETYFDLPFLMQRRSAEGIMKILYAHASVEEVLKQILNQ